MDREITRTYTNGEVTILWRRGRCIHSTLCFHGLPQVFDPSQRPWVNPRGASTDAILEQVRRCPSGALACVMNDDLATDHGVRIPSPAAVPVPTSVDVLRDGPLLVHGALVVSLPGGETVARAGVTAFCRCGHSGNSPYCDGSHATRGFQD